MTKQNFHATAIAGLATVMLSATAAFASEEGQIAFNNHCRTCHSTDAGDNRLGPNLHEIMGRKAGAAEGYGYSSAFQSADFKWTPEKMNAFIENPDGVVRGNNMKPYSGIAEADIREAIVEHLSSQSAEGSEQ